MPRRALPPTRRRGTATASQVRRGGALGRAALDVLGALVWVFHNARSGCCFPSYERIAERAGVARSTVAEAIKALEFAGVLTWQNRIVRIRERCRDLFGKEGWRWRVIRTSNAYAFCDPQLRADRGAIPSQSDDRTGTPDQDASKPLQAPAIDPNSPLERALARLGAALAAKNGIEEAAG